MTVKSSSVILFDGNCNYCTNTVLWLIKRDSKKQFLFTATGVPAGYTLLREKNLEHLQDTSVILLHNEKVYLKSDAVLRIAGQLPFYKFFFFLILIPRFIRDWLYDIVARNRYKWFGRRETCFIPDEKLKERFL